MNYLTNLKPFLGSEKTLIITDAAFHTDHHFGSNDYIYTYRLPQGTLLRYDHDQQEALQYYIYDQRCLQIIYISPQQPVSQPENQSHSSLDLSLKFNLTVLLRHQKDNAIRPAIRRQMLLEIHVIDQCKLLMEYFFIRKKVEDCELQLKGLVTELNGTRFKSIFCNGISYNDLLTLN